MQQSEIMTIWESVTLRIWCHLQTRLSTMSRGDRGASSVEYAVLAAFVAGVIIAVVRAIGAKTGNNFDSLDTRW